MCGRLGLVNHAADGIVGLMGLTHQGHMTCGWSRMGVSAMVGDPSVTVADAVGIVDF